MIRSWRGLVLTAFIQLIFSQAQELDLPITQYIEEIPRHCLGLPPGIDIHRCCPVPSLYPDEVMEQCGIKKVRPDDPNVPPRSKESPKVPCKEGICLMHHADLLMPNQSVDYEKLRAFVDQWAETNPEFTDAILEAKKICARDGGPLGPPVCEQDRIFFCLSSNVLWNCNLQNLDGTSGCSILKAHMDECRPHFLKMKDRRERELEKQNFQQN